MTGVQTCALPISLIGYCYCTHTSICWQANTHTFRHLRTHISHLQADTRRHLSHSLHPPSAHHTKARTQWNVLQLKGVNLTSSLSAQEHIPPRPPHSTSTAASSPPSTLVHNLGILLDPTSSSFLPHVHQVTNRSAEKIGRASCRERVSSPV